MIFTLDVCRPTLEVLVNIMTITEVGPAPQDFMASMFSEGEEVWDPKWWGWKKGFGVFFWCTRTHSTSNTQRCQRSASTKSFYRELCLGGLAVLYCLEQDVAVTVQKQLHSGHLCLCMWGEGCFFKYSNSSVCNSHQQDQKWQICFVF